jgi:putative tricarboxylic transport membrane protein
MAMAYQRRGSRARRTLGPATSRPEIDGAGARIVAIRKAILYDGMAIVALVGAYAATYSIFQMGLAIVFGVIAYFLRKQGYPSVSLLLGFILGPDLEQFFRRSLSLNDGNPMVFLTSPDSLFFLGLTGVFIWFMVIRPPRVVARLPEAEGGGS